MGVAAQMTRLRYEVQALGWANIGLPLLVVGVFSSVGLLAAYEAGRSGGAPAQTHSDFARVLLWMLEFGLPISAGFAAGNLIGSNPARELHFTLPTGYRAVMVGRLALLVVWAALVCGGAATLMRATGYWLAPQTAWRGELIWLAPLLWLLMGGAALTLILGSRAVSGATLGMLAVGELLFRGYFLQNMALRHVFLFLTLTQPNADYWNANRLTLLALALVFAGVTVYQLGRSELLLTRES